MVRLVWKRISFSVSKMLKRRNTEKVPRTAADGKECVELTEGKGVTPTARLSETNEKFSRK